MISLMPQIDSVSLRTV